MILSMNSGTHTDNGAETMNAGTLITSSRGFIGTVTRRGRWTGGLIRLWIRWDPTDRAEAMAWHGNGIWEHEATAR
jgi:hypothetical protein